MTQCGLRMTSSVSMMRLDRSSIASCFGFVVDLDLELVLVELDVVGKKSVLVGSNKSFDMSIWTCRGISLFVSRKRFNYENEWYPKLDFADVELCYCKVFTGAMWVV
tara:strand:+ start:496 stop:816 length:321 start_codon:yes stop_codon:yes gene_type:complete